MASFSPYIPERITVHLGSPSSYAANVTVPFSDYVKNVASSEIYPTWDDSALTANILAIISFALNRVYTEFYRSQGYDFEITSSTAIDQKFINGRNYFDSVSRIVDNIFNNYLRRQGFIEPLAAKFCNGTTVTCEGLSQWGSQELARQGLNSVQILRRYYGNDVEIVTNAPIRGYQPSYPGTLLRQNARKNLNVFHEDPFIFRMVCNNIDRNEGLERSRLLTLRPGGRRNCDRLNFAVFIGQTCGDQARPILCRLRYRDCNAPNGKLRVGRISANR